MNNAEFKRVGKCLMGGITLAGLSGLIIGTLLGRSTAPVPNYEIDIFRTNQRASNIVIYDEKKNSAEITLRDPAEDFSNPNSRAYEGIREFKEANPNFNIKVFDTDR